MKADFTIKKGDTLPDLVATLQNADGSPMDLTGATVRFLMVSQSGAVKVDRAATIQNAAGGEVKALWQVGDTDTVGIYLCEFEVTYTPSRIVTVPNNGYLTVEILGDLA